MKTDMAEQTVWVMVTVEHPIFRIRCIHYVEVAASFVHKELWAANQEREKGYKVISTELWRKP